MVAQTFDGNLRIGVQHCHGRRSKKLSHNPEPGSTVAPSYDEGGGAAAWYLHTTRLRNGAFGPATRRETRPAAPRRGGAPRQLGRKRRPWLARWLEAEF